MNREENIHIKPLEYISKHLLRHSTRTLQNYERQPSRSRSLDNVTTRTALRCPRKDATNRRASIKLICLFHSFQAPSLHFSRTLREKKLVHTCA